MSDEELARAKNLLKADFALSMDTDGGSLEEIGLQALLTGKVASQSEVGALVDSISTADVNGILKKGKLCMASFGKIAKVPHVGELK